MIQDALFLVDQDRPSYVEAARLYREAFAAAGVPVRETSCVPSVPDAEGAWVVHHTIGPLLRPVAGAHNTAVIFHEWDRYPAAWVDTLNAFQSVWAPSTHVVETLRVSGVTVPVHVVPPPVAASRFPEKPSYHPSLPFRFLSIGEPHFRKGFHLLINGFLAAFPDEGEATLTLKVSSSCRWQSPRADITVVADRLDRGDLLSLYQEHDAYVTASLGEGLGLPVAEAVLVGLPVAANLWGGHRDLVQPSACWPIGHEVVPQVFCSDPSYFAVGQCCAWSSTDRIATALRNVFVAPAIERARRAIEARSALEDSHGVARVAALVSERAEAIAAASPRSRLDALSA